MIYHIKVLWKMFIFHCGSFSPSADELAGVVLKIIYSVLTAVKSRVFISRFLMLKRRSKSTDGVDQTAIASTSLGLHARRFALIFQNQGSISI